MERYEDCLKYMSNLQETVDNIKKATRREEVEEFDQQAKDLVQRLHLKAPYMIKEIHDLGIRKRTEIINRDSQLAVRG